jgi:hypothetical protein
VFGFVWPPSSGGQTNRIRPGALALLFASEVHCRGIQLRDLAAIAATEDRLTRCCLNGGADA